MASLNSSICQVCEADATSRCSACKEVFYCGAEHQKADWKNHKEDCARRRAAQQRVAAAKAQAKALESIEVGHCGIHEKTDYSQYIHALNNMAGAHKIDQPLGDESQNSQFLDNFEEDEELPWNQLENDRILNNGIIILAGSQIRREAGEFGHGIAVQGKIKVGELIYELDGSCDQRFDLPAETSISSFCTTLENAWIDSLLVIHGPLRYHDSLVTDKMGVHSSGTMFELLEDERYLEHCIDRILQNK